MKSSRRRELEKRRGKNQKLREISEYCKQHVIPWPDYFQKSGRRMDLDTTEFIEMNV